MPITCQAMCETLRIQKQMRWDFWRQKSTIKVKNGSFSAFISFHLSRVFHPLPISFLPKPSLLIPARMLQFPSSLREHLFPVFSARASSTKSLKAGATVPCHVPQIIPSVPTALNTTWLLPLIPCLQLTPFPRVPDHLLDLTPCLLTSISDLN